MWGILRGPRRKHFRRGISRGPRNNFRRKFCGAFSGVPAIISAGNFVGYKSKTPASGVLGAKSLILRQGNLASVFGPLPEYYKGLRNQHRMGKFAFGLARAAEEVQVCGEEMTLFAYTLRECYKIKIKLKFLSPKFQVYVMSDQKPPLFSGDSVPVSGCKHFINIKAPAGAAAAARGHSAGGSMSEGLSAS